MIDERLNFNQNGAWSVFREVNRLISQPSFHPPSHSPLLFLSTWPLLTLAHHSSLSHQHLALLLSASTIRPSFFPLLWFTSRQPIRVTDKFPSHAAYTIRHIPLSYQGELEHQSSPSAHLISHSIIHHKTMRWEEGIQQTEAIHMPMVSCIIASPLPCIMGGR